MIIVAAITITRGIIKTGGFNINDYIQYSFTIDLQQVINKTRATQTPLGEIVVAVVEAELPPRTVDRSGQGPVVPRSVTTLHTHTFSRGEGGSRTRVRVRVACSIPLARFRRDRIVFVFVWRARKKKRGGGGGGHGLRL